MPTYALDDYMISLFMIGLSFISASFNLAIAWKGREGTLRLSLFTND